MLIQNSVMATTAVTVIGILGLYYWLVYRFGILKSKAEKTSPLNVNYPNGNADVIPRHITKTAAAPMVLPPAVESTSLAEPEEIDDSGFEIIAAEDMTLLKEAERVVDKIQDCINHIATDPPNPEEVSSKIKAVIQPYCFFQETEYYDSINTYIALSVERDCGIKLTPQEVQACWN
ncbi:hypothetical protein [Chitinophaga sp. GbtcB8]|uniref:hypothetical protein n=1 Tax=Chitinophaga sp. GbtcB8 TaxID=2824753 RepID=UPI001C2F8288|nr:hypothetical protein [Chitinophaga sp. GbtcB8]